MITSVLETLTVVLGPWAELYSHSRTIETVVQFAHIGGLLLSGGLAIAADRGTLRALHLAATERHAHLRELAAVHRLVLGGLATVVVSGAALFASDVETYSESWVFWVKMAFVMLLLANGLAMTRAERALVPATPDDSPQWTILRRAAVSSLTLWIAVTALGVALTNYA